MGSLGVSSTPRVLVLGSVLGQGMGGVRRHNQELLPRAAQLLSESGGSLSVLEGLEPCAFELPDTIERIPSQVPSRPALRRAMAEGHALRNLLDERAREGRPFHWVHTAHQPVPRGFDTSLSLLIHDLRSLTKAHSPFSRRLVARELIGRSANRARLLMTVSESMADEMATTLQVDRETIQVIPNGADHFTPRPRVDDPRGPLLCVGHLEPRKNQELLLRAIALDTTLPDVEFVGANKGDALTKLQALARELGIQDRVRFSAASDEEVNDATLADLYANTMCVVLPSTLEGFGIVAVEALRAGAPLAVSRIPAHMEVCPPEIAAFENDPADCARAIHEALATPPGKLSAFRAASDRFNWQASAATLVECWRMDL
jgi:glycosyltransferase involved in cell wall biosynthesis